MRAVQSDAKVPTVKVKLSRTVRLLPHQCVTAAVEVDQLRTAGGAPLLLEIAGDGTLQSEDVLIEPSGSGRAHLLLSNPSRCSHVVTKGTCIGEVVKILEESECSNLEAQDFEDDWTYPNIRRILPALSAQERIAQVKQLVPEPISLDTRQKQDFYEFLEKHHTVFSVEPEERGETDLIEMEICTGDAEPIKQGMRRMPFTVRCEVAR